MLNEYELLGDLAGSFDGMQSASGLLPPNISHGSLSHCLEQGPEVVI